MTWRVRSVHTVNGIDMILMAPRNVAVEPCGGYELILWQWHWPKGVFPPSLPGTYAKNALAGW